MNVGGYIPLAGPCHGLGVYSSLWALSWVGVYSSRWALSWVLGYIPLVVPYQSLLVATPLSHPFSSGYLFLGSVSIDRLLSGLQSPSHHD